MVERCSAGARWSAVFLWQRLVGAPVRPNGDERRAEAQRSWVRAATLRQAVNFIRWYAADTHSVFPDTGAREAYSAEAAIKMAHPTLVSPWTLTPRHRWPMMVRDTVRSNCHAQRAALLRPALANPHVIENASKFCPQGPRRVWRARMPTTGRRSSSSTSRRCAKRFACSRSSTVRCLCRARPRLTACC